MTDYLIKLEQVETSVTSSTRVATVTMGGQPWMRISLNPEIVNEHDDASLAEEVEEAVQDCRAKYAMAIRKIRDAFRETRRNNARPPLELVVKRKREFAGRTTEIETKVVSPRNCVTVKIFGDGDILISIAPGTLRRVDISTDLLVGELNNSVVSGLREARQRKFEVHQEMYSGNRQQ